MWGFNTFSTNIYITSEYLLFVLVSDLHPLLSVTVSPLEEKLQPVRHTITSANLPSNNEDTEAANNNNERTEIYLIVKDVKMWGVRVKLNE